MPRNMQSWREELPKANYIQDMEGSLEEKQTQKHRFGHLSQQKLKDIVRQKNPESSSILHNPSKKHSIKRVTPDIINSSMDHHKPPQSNFHQAQTPQLPHLPGPVRKM